MDKIDFVLAGVGGQGIVLLSDLLGETALAAGYDVKKSDVFGMAQRGGSVSSFVRIGERVSSPLPRPGEVDFLIALEKLEAARWASHLRPGGVAVVNDHTIFPLSVGVGADRYPSDEEVVSSLRDRTDRVRMLDGSRIAAEMGNPRVLNVIILGFVASLLPISWPVWIQAVERRIPARHRELNLRALEAGRQAALAANLS